MSKGRLEEPATSVPDCAEGSEGKQQCGAPGGVPSLSALGLPAAARLPGSDRAPAVGQTGHATAHRAVAIPSPRAYSDHAMAASEARTSRADHERCTTRAQAFLLSFDASCYP